jgi:hypothetical protein
LPPFYEIKSCPVCLVLPDFCQFCFKNEPAGYWPDRTGHGKAVRFQLWFI